MSNPCPGSMLASPETLSPHLRLFRRVYLVQWRVFQCRKPRVFAPRTGFRTLTEKVQSVHMILTHSYVIVALPTLLTLLTLQTWLCSRKMLSKKPWKMQSSASTGDTFFWIRIQLPLKPFCLCTCCIILYSMCFICLSFLIYFTHEWFGPAMSCDSLTRTNSVKIKPGLTFSPVSIVYTCLEMLMQLNNATLTCFLWEADRCDYWSMDE